MEARYLRFMRLYIKSDFTKIDFTTRACLKMWFKERNGKKISFNVGDDMLQDDFYFGVQLHKWSQVDEKTGMISSYNS